eukprot:scaffold21455_cov116-Cylindrotheca_fusiformis.AAC.11
MFHVRSSLTEGTKNIKDYRKLNEISGIQCTLFYVILSARACLSTIAAQPSPLGKPPFPYCEQSMKIVEIERHEKSISTLDYPLIIHFQQKAVHTNLALHFVLLQPFRHHVKPFASSASSSPISGSKSTLMPAL